MLDFIVALEQIIEEEGKEDGLWWLRAVHGGAIGVTGIGERSRPDDDLTWKFDEVTTNEWQSVATADVVHVDP